MLYIVSTPIGNLKDITYRAVEMLHSCDYILCEDTRHSQTLLQHYQIQKPLKSYHEFNETAKLEAILSDLKAGKNIALISDSGTPLICDPGQKLIEACRKEHIPLTAIPGPCALIAALSQSGLSTESFQFLGFFPRKEKESMLFALRIQSYEGVSIFYESPQRIIDTLTLFTQLMPKRILTIAREMTKTFEELLTGHAEELLSHFHSHPPKGEIVVLVKEGPDSGFYQDLSPQDLVNYLVSTYGLSLSDAVKTAAHLKNVPKQSVYKQIHCSED